MNFNIFSNNNNNLPYSVTEYGIMARDFVKKMSSEEAHYIKNNNNNG